MHIFSTELIDLAEASPRYAGVLTPSAELGRPKQGVSEFLLSGAGEYFSRFEHYSYSFHLLQRAIRRFPKPPNGLAIDIGSGFGNTVIPLLDTYPDLRIVATDISPDLLAILRSEAGRRGTLDRCTTVAFDLHGDYFRTNVADAIFGGAVLHHLVDPRHALRNILKALRPGGRAVFFEPFQAGFAILRIAYEQILAEAQRRKAKGPAFQFLNAICRDIHVRSHRRVLSDTGMTWEQLDDKWLFCASYFKELGATLGVAAVEIEQIAEPEGMFESHTRNSLIDYGQLNPSDLPAWAWDTLRRFDQEYLTNDLKREMTLEAIVTFTM